MRVSQKRFFLIFFLRLFVKYPKLIFIALLLGGLSYAYEFFYARDAMVFAGVPKSQEHFTRIFRNDAYILGYSDSKGNPLWVVYKLTSPKPDAPHLKRPESFHADWRNGWFIGSNDYTNSGYDRGHMAPNHAMALLYGKNAQEQTFLMTNITPQRPSLNQKLWQQLESIELDTFASQFKELWVYTGPLFDVKTTRLKSSYFVEIPDAFYKIYVGIEANGTPQTLALIIPQNAKANDSFEKYVVSIDEIEKRSGFDFLHQLDDAMEAKLEREISGKQWFKAH